MFRYGQVLVTRSALRKLLIPSQRLRNGAAPTVVLWKNHSQISSINLHSLSEKSLIRSLRCLKFLRHEQWRVQIFNAVITKSALATVIVIMRGPARQNTVADNGKRLATKAEKAL